MIDLSSWQGILAAVATLVVGWLVRHRFGNPLAPSNPSPATPATPGTPTDAGLLARLLEQLRRGGQGGGGQVRPLLDFDGSGTVDLRDLLFLLVQGLANRPDLEPAAALAAQQQVLAAVGPLIVPAAAAKPAAPPAAGS